MIKKILVVDNSMAILKMMTTMLGAHGYEVKTAEDGLCALAALETFDPDVIFVDMVMPKISGDKLCPLLRSMPKLKHAYIVILSAIAAEQEIDFIGLGANACIAKGPFKEIENDILAVLDMFDQQRTETLSLSPVGVEKLYKREITRELLSIQKHYAVALNNMANGFLELTPDTTIVFANTSATEMFGIPELKLLASQFTELFDERQRLRIQQVLKSLGERPVMIGEFTPVVHDDKHFVMNFVPIIDQGVRSIVVVIHDITQRKEGEKKLTEYYERLDASLTERSLAIEQMKEMLDSEMAARKKADEDNERLATELQVLGAKVETLIGLLPFCVSCREKREDTELGSQIDAYIQDLSDSTLAPGVCRGCAKKI